MEPIVWVQIDQKMVNTICFWFDSRIFFLCAQTAVGISVHKRELFYAFRSYQGYAKLRLVVAKGASE